MAEEKPKATPKAAAKRRRENPHWGQPTFAPMGGEEPDTVTASWGEEGEDPREVGFVGTKPDDEPATVQNVAKR
jgi:hypothetical protein